MDPDLSIAGARFQELLAGVLRALPNVLIGLLALLVFIAMARALKLLVQTIRPLQAKRNLALVLGRLSQSALILVGLLVAATISFPSFTPANLIGALGITGIAVGFAFRDIFENFLAGILILITEPFRLDDQIVFGKYEGTVVAIETRATKIRTYDGRIVVIPNGELFKNSIIVNTACAHRRMEHDFGIGYGDDIAQAKQVMLAALPGINGVLTDPPPDALMVGLSDSTVLLRLRWWIHPPRRADALDIADQVLTRVKQSLTAAGIDLPFPIQHVLFHDQTETCDGDRAGQREGWPLGPNGAPGPARIIDGLRALGAARSQEPQ